MEEETRAEIRRPTHRVSSRGQFLGAQANDSFRLGREGR